MPSPATRTAARAFTFLRGAAMEEEDGAFRATFHSHIIELRNRDISHVLRILTEHAPAALVWDETDVPVEEKDARGVGRAGHAASAAARPCARCGAPSAPVGGAAVRLRRRPANHRRRCPSRAALWRRRAVLAFPWRSTRSRVHGPMFRARGASAPSRATRTTPRAAPRAPRRAGAVAPPCHCATWTRTRPRAPPCRCRVHTKDVEREFRATPWRHTASAVRFGS